jgi:hypothetical protein
MRPTPYVASLRVYEPLESFPADEQFRWEQIPTTSPTRFEEQRAALHRTIVAEQLALKPDGAHILKINEEKFVAPWSTATRCWAALDNFRSSLPLTLVNYFLTQKIEDAINTHSEVVKDKVSHIITATWSIPPRWFALFEPSDRIRGSNDDGLYTIQRTSIANAKQRCLFAQQVVLNAFGQGPIEQEIADLLQWLGVFHSRSIVECDYCGLAVYLEKALSTSGEPGLDSDTSIEDVAKSLAGLESGNGALAGQGYERLITRWRKVSAFEQAM